MHLEHEAWQAAPLGLLWVDLHGWRIEHANPVAKALLGLSEQAAPLCSPTALLRTRRSPWSRLHKTRQPGPVRR